MLSVSADFKTAAVAAARQVAKRVKIWLVDNNSQAGTITVTADELDATLFPKAALINGRTTAAKKWALARDDCFPADDLYPIDTGYEGGWFDDTLSDANGDLAVPLEIVLQYGVALGGPHLEWWGDAWLGYPVDFEWFYWNSVTSAWVSVASVTGNTATSYSMSGSTITQTWSKFKLKITKISRANSHANLIEVQVSQMADISSYIKSLEILKERYYNKQGTIPVGNAAASELVMVLNNLGLLFDPRGSGGTFAGNILPNRKVTVELGFVLPGGTTEYCAAGVYYTKSWTTDWGGMTTVRAYDGTKKLLRKKYAGAVQEGKTVGELVETVCQASGLSPDQYLIDATTQVIPYAVFESKTVWEHLRKLAEAEGGFIYFDESGILRFENRAHLAGHAAETLQIDWTNSLNLKDASDEERIRNVVRAVSKRLKESASATIWNLQETLTVPGSSRLTIEVRFQYPAVDVAAPVITAGGAHVTVDSYSYTTKGGTVTLANSDAAAETVTGMTIDGKSLVSDGEIVAEATNTALVAAYGEVAYEIQNDFIQSLEQAQDLVDDLLASYSNPCSEIEVEMPTRGQPHLQLGDKLTVLRVRPAIFANFYVVRSRLRYDGALDGTLTLLQE